MLTRNEYESYRAMLDDVAKSAELELSKLWSSLNLSSFSATTSELFDVMQDILNKKQGGEAAKLGGMFYEELRQRAVSGHFNALLATFDWGQELQENIAEALKPLFSSGGIAGNSSKALKTAQTILKRNVLGMASTTVGLNASREKQSTKCASIPSLGCKCKFCLAFASMGFGFVYREKAEKRSGVWHDNCRCQMVPGFGDNPSLDWYDPERYAKLREYILDGVISVQDGANPYEKELDVGIWLADAGHVVKFLKPTIKYRTADCLVDGILREMKIPEGNRKEMTVGSNNAWTQFKNAITPTMQSDKLIISHHLIADLISEREYMNSIMDAWKKWTQITEVWFVRANGNIVKL